MNTRHRFRTFFRRWPVWQIMLARLRDAYRRPETIFWVYGFPVIMIITLGAAFRNRPAERIVVDVQKGPLAQAVADTLRKSKDMEVRQSDVSTWRRRLRIGRADVVVLAVAPDALQYRYVYDPTRPRSVVARNAIDDWLQRAAGRVDSVVAKNVKWDETGGRYIDFLVPGLLGLSMMGGGMWGVGFATVDMRIRKVLKRLVATPMKKSHFLMGIMISRLFFIVPEVMLILGVSWLVFEVSIFGRLLSVLLLICLGAATFAGIGLLVGSRAQTLETVSGLMNLVMLPMWVLSGIFFPSERFPDFAQPLIKVLPLTPLINSLRSVMLEDASLADQLPELCLLTVWGLVAFGLALRWFRWT